MRSLYLSDDWMRVHLQGPFPVPTQRCCLLDEGAPMRPLCSGGGLARVYAPAPRAMPSAASRVRVTIANGLQCVHNSIVGRRSPQASGVVC